MSRKIMEQVIQTVEKQLDLQLEAADMGKTLEDLGADSMDLLQIGLEIEEAHKIHLVDEVIFEFQSKNIREIVEQVEKIVHESEGK